MLDFFNILPYPFPRRQTRISSSPGRFSAFVTEPARKPTLKACGRVNFLIRADSVDRNGNEVALVRAEAPDADQAEQGKVRK